MDQLSLFGAEQRAPVPADVAGLLAGRGQSTLSGGRARVAVVVDDRWRAEAVERLFRAAGLEASSEALGERHSVTTGWSEELVDTVSAWRRGAVSAVPEGWVTGPHELRAWLLSSGRVRGDGGVELGLDPALEQHAPRREALARALSSAGIRCTYVGVKGGGPSLRLSGARARARLAELVGEAPEGAPPGAWPS